MSKNNKRNIITLSIIATAVILILLGVLSLILKTFVIDAILHIYVRLFLVAVIIKILQKSFRNQLTNSMNKALILCGCTIALDLVVIDGFRYVLSNGISTVLFLPICLPVCFMIIMFYSAKDTGRDKMAEIRGAYILAIPLLLLSLYFEILSFVQV